MDREDLTAMLDQALLVEGEPAKEKDEWKARFRDPFPVWNVAISAIGTVMRHAREHAQSLA